MSAVENKYDKIINSTAVFQSSDILNVDLQRQGRISFYTDLGAKLGGSIVNLEMKNTSSMAHTTGFPFPCVGSFTYPGIDTR